MPSELAIGTRSVFSELHRAKPVAGARIVLLAILAGCSPQAQSERAALEVLCGIEQTVSDLPRDFVEAGARLEQEARARITNTAVRSILDETRSVRAALLKTSAARHALPCKALASPLVMSLPETRETHARELTPAWPDLRVTRDAVLLNAEVVFSLNDGRIPAAEIVPHREIPRLRAALAAAPKPPVRTVIAFEHDVPYETVLGIAIEVLRARKTSISILTHKDGRAVAVPIAGLLKTTSGSLGMMIEVTAEAARVFSVSGRAGNSNDPFLRVTRSREGYAQIAHALEKVYRELGTVSEEDRIVYIMLNDEMTAQDLADVVGVLAMVDGQQLHPLIMESWR